MDSTQKIAQFVESLKFSDIPAEGIDRVKQCFLDFIGNAAMAKAHSDSIDPIRKTIQSLAGGAGPGTVIAHREGLPLQYAALLNGTLAHSLDFDDTNFKMGGHPGTCIFPAAMAMSEYRGGSGEDFLTAAIAGYEVACRIGEALGPTTYLRGFHGTAIAGIFGATAAGAKVLEMNAAKIEDAIGLNISQAAGSMQYLENGSWNKRLNPGLAAHNSVLSLFFSENGFRGAARPLEGDYGLLKGYCDSPQPEKLTAGLGEEWLTLLTGLKPYPSCRHNHATIDNMIALRKIWKGSVDELEEVKIFLPSKAYDIVGKPTSRKIGPENSVDAQFSVYFQGAISLTEGDVKWESYQKLKDPRILKLMQKMKVEKDTQLARYNSRVILKIDKIRHESRVDFPKGEPENPMSWDEVIHKFRNSVQSVYSPGNVEAIVRDVKNFEKIPLVQSWVKKLRAST